MTTNTKYHRIMSKEEQLHLAALIKAERHQKLHELGRMIKGTSTVNLVNTKGASDIVNNKPRKQGYLERQFKLRELGRMIRG